MEIKYCAVPTVICKISSLFRIKSVIVTIIRISPLRSTLDTFSTKRICFSLDSAKKLAESLVTKVPKIQSKQLVPHLRRGGAP